MSTPVWTVYCHVHVDSRRCYIGLTKKSMTRRWKEHVCNAKAKSGKGCRHFWNAIRKYGKDAFSHHVLTMLPDIESGNAWKDFWIDFFDARNPEKGFNLAPGGRCKPQRMDNNPWDRPGFGANSLKNLALGRATTRDPARVAALVARNKTMVLSEESRARISASSSSRIVSDETRSKLSAAAIGRKLSPERAAKLREMGAAQSARLRSRTYCKHGHDLSDAYVRRSDGERICRTCVRLREERRRSASCSVIQ